MINIYPSILVQDASVQISQLHGLVDVFEHFQLDIADGIYVDNNTLTIDDMLAVSNDYAFLKAQNRTIEMHLMVEDFTTALQKVDQLASFLKITRTFIHLGPFQRAQHIIPNTKYPVCMCINPDEDVSQNFKVLKSFDAIQLMTIQPGKQGNPFVPEALLKINELRELGYTGDILLDGAMNDQTFPFVLNNKHLPTAICPGSYFVKNEPHEALKRLRDMETASLR